jgi:hypothetical protein
MFETLCPIADDPVNDTSSNLLSLINYSPTSFPDPTTMVRTPSGQLFLFNTSATILVEAMVTKETEEAPFHTVKLPVAIAMARFQKNTAFGKLKAEITPIKPNGFHYSIMK